MGKPQEGGGWVFNQVRKGRISDNIVAQIKSAIFTGTYRSGDKVDEVHTDIYKGQYLYKEGDQYIFMNTETFEQHFLPEEQLGDKGHFLKEGTTVMVMMMEGKPIDVTLPIAVEFKVVSCEATSRKETVSAQGKTAILDTGFALEVPTFVKEGDLIRVDTRTGTYLERVSTKK